MSVALASVRNATSGESVVEKDWEFTVVEVDRHRIEQVRVVAPEVAHHD